MKPWALRLAAVGCLLASSIPAPAAEPWPVVIGHRGLGQNHAPEPENSITALVEAFRRKVTSVEFDVQLTADGEVVLAHDPDLARISSGRGCVADATLAQLRSLMLKDGTGALHRDLTFDTFREALRFIRRFDSPDRPFLADVHIKVYDLFRGDDVSLDNRGCPFTDVEQLTSKVLRIAHEEGMLERLIFTAFDRRVLDQIRATAPSARTGLLTWFTPGTAIEEARGRYEFVALNKDHIKESHVAAAHQAGLKVLVWSPKRASDLTEELDTLLVDGVITDDVEAAVRVKETCRR